jgi:hypothetical protein
MLVQVLRGIVMPGSEIPERQMRSEVEPSELETVSEKSE